MQIQHHELVVVTIVALVKQKVQQVFYGLHRLHSQTTVYRRIEIEVKIHNHFLRIKRHILKRLGARQVSLQELLHHRFLYVGLLIIFQLIQILLKCLQPLFYFVWITQANIAQTFSEKYFLWREKV